MSSLLALGRPHRGLLGVAFACMALVGLTTGAYAWLMGPALRFLLTGGVEGLGALAAVVPTSLAADREALRAAFPLVVVVIGALKGVGYLGQFYFVGLFGQRVVLDLRRQLFTRLLGLSPLQRSTRLSGDLLSRFTSDVAAVEQAATTTVASWLRDSLQIAILVVVAVALSWKLALLASLAVPFAIWPASRLTRSLLRRTREGQAALGTLAGQVHEGLGALRTLQAYEAGPAEAARFAVRTGQVRHALIRAGWSRAAVPGVMEVLASAAIAGTLGWATGASGVPPEALVSFLGTLILLYQPAKDLGRVSQFAVAAGTALERIGEILALPAAVTRPANAADLPPLSTAVRLEAVDFAWGERHALRGCTFELPAGQTTALVGASGSGKSTVASLLLGFQAPLAGRLTFDGRDAAGAALASQRAQFALVTQEPLLFSATVRENLLLARPDATPAQLEEAARLAQADTFIHLLPQGWDTAIGERGVTLSGGQKQRLCLARALLSGAPVLVLDEATSSLDPESEREVQRALDGLLGQRTALVIAHRLDTVQRAHAIVVLDQGRVVEQGTHAELLARQGAYARLWHAQHATG